MFPINTAGKPIYSEPHDLKKTLYYPINDMDCARHEPQPPGRRPRI